MVAFVTQMYKVQDIGFLSKVAQGKMAPLAELHKVGRFLAKLQSRLAFLVSCTRQDDSYQRCIHCVR